MEENDLREWKYACPSADEAPLTVPILFRGDICTNLNRAALLGYSAIEVHTRETAELDYDAIRRTVADCKAKVCMIITERRFTEEKVNLINDVPYITDSAIIRYEKVRGHGRFAKC